MPFSPAGLYLSNSLPDVEANAFEAPRVACCPAAVRQAHVAMLVAWLQACTRLRCILTGNTNRPTTFTNATETFALIANHVLGRVQPCCDWLSDTSAPSNGRQS